MKTKAFIFFSLLICNLLPAQNIKLDITPHFLGVRADSLLLSMDVSVEIENMESKNAVKNRNYICVTRYYEKKASIRKRTQPTSLPVSTKVIPAPSLTELRCPQKIG